MQAQLLETLCLFSLERVITRAEASNERGGVLIKGIKLLCSRGYSAALLFSFSLSVHSLYNSSHTSREPERKYRGGGGVKHAPHVDLTVWKLCMDRTPTSALSTSI